MEKKLRIDRIEENIAVAYDDGGNEYKIIEEPLQIKESDIVTAEFDECGNIIAISTEEEETAAVKNDFQGRLDKLFGK